ncbi:MAG TPA: AAA family ATPase [Thermoleophilia bacterium]|nr:AAA family ATPase [Thermoleophilia bacterium]
MKKAVPIAAPLKMSVYGPHGSGKSLTSLLFAEGLAKWRKKRVAYIDTEYSTKTYRQANPLRQVHPEEFDFDVADTRSLADALSEIKNLDPKVYGVIVLDSITRLWDAAREAWISANPEKRDIPINAWSAIKRPYKELMQIMMQGPFDVIITGRQRTVFETVDGRMENAGVAMRAEGETQFEPDICLRFEMYGRRGEDGVVSCFAEKDRYGVLSGRTFSSPTFAVIEPLLPFLGDSSPKSQTDEEAAEIDSDLMGNDKAEKKIAKSQGLFREFSAKLLGCNDVTELGSISAEMKKAKRYIVAEHQNALRELYLSARDRTAAPEGGI